jgi:transcriptional regulator with XRE-family HTH domain
LFVGIGSLKEEREVRHMDGTKLVAARKRLCWTQERAAEEFGVGLTTIHRWEKGEVIPRGDSLLLIQEKYGLTPKDLGITEEPGNGKERKSDTVAFQLSEHLHHLRTLALHDLYTRLWSLSFQPYSSYQSLQDAINLILKEDDTMHTNQPNHHIKRREALQSLITLPFAPALLSINTADTLEQKVDSNTLAQYALGIAACRELLKSAERDDLVTALHGVSAYVPPLQAIVKNFSQHRQEAASLIAQALKLKTTLALHLQNPYQALLAADEAVTYAEESGDIALLVEVLTDKTWVFIKSHDYQNGLLSSQRAITQMEQAHKKQPLPAIIRWGAYDTYAIVQAKQGQDIASSLHNSSVALADLSAGGEKSPAYVDAVPEGHPLDRAQAQYNARNYTETLKTLNQLVDLDSQSFDLREPLPERLTCAVLNFAALAELKDPRRDKEKALLLWKAGALRARSFQSELRFKEVLAGYDLMEVLWPDDPEIRDFYELTVHW